MTCVITASVKKLAAERAEDIFDLRVRIRFELCCILGEITHEATYERALCFDRL